MSIHLPYKRWIRENFHKKISVFFIFVKIPRNVYYKNISIVIILFYEVRWPGDHVCCCCEESPDQTDDDNTAELNTPDLTTSLCSVNSSLSLDSCSPHTSPQTSIKIIAQHLEKNLWFSNLLLSWRYCNCFTSLSLSLSLSLSVCLSLSLNFELDFDASALTLYDWLTDWLYQFQLWKINHKYQSNDCVSRKNKDVSVINDVGWNFSMLRPWSTTPLTN